MEKPIEPNVEDCCNSGCNPCIFEVYEKQLELYNKHINGESVLINVSQDNGISQLKYTEFVVIKNVTVCHSHNFIAFRRLTVDSKKVWWRPGDHFLFKFNADKISCSRAYTPIKDNNLQNENYDFSIIVKKYDSGLVSNYLCSLNSGNVTFWRGPYGHYKLELNKFKRIVMIAQGTGLAPFITIIDHILHNEDDMTKVVLLYCCKCENSILFREKLYAFKSYWNFKYDIFLSNSSTHFKQRYKEPIKCHKLNKKYLFDLKPFSNDQVLLCGSPKFIEEYNVFFKSEVPEIENIILF